MGKYLRSVEFGVRADTAGDVERLTRELTSAAACYASLVRAKKVPADGISKVVVELGETDGHDRTLDVDVLLARTDALRDATDGQRLAASVEACHRRLRAHAGAQGWPTEPFDEAFAELSAAAFRYSGVWRRPATNRRSGLTARLRWRMTDWLYLDVAVTDRSGTTVREFQHVCTAVGAGVLAAALGSLSWHDDRRLRLHKKHAPLGYWEFDLETGQVRFTLARAETGDAHGLFDLAKMLLFGSWETATDPDRGLELLTAAAHAGHEPAVRLLDRCPR